MSDMGTSRPDSRSSTVKYNSNTALTRVTQNVTSPSAHSSVKRMMNAVTRATRKPATIHG